MSANIKIDQIRGEVLNRIDRTERRFKLAFIGAAVVEILFFLSFLLLADLSNRLHLLMLITAVASYTIIILGLMALGAHMSRNTLRILKAIEMLDK